MTWSPAPTPSELSLWRAVMEACVPGSLWSSSVRDRTLCGINAAAYLDLVDAIAGDP